MQRSDTGFRGPITPPVTLNVTTGQSPVTTSAYTQLIASTPNAFGGMLILNSSGSLLMLAMGAPGAEKNILAFSGGGTIQDILNIEIPAGTRLSLKAIDANTTSGWVCATFFQ